MTRTEDRLADALGASAAQVRDDRLRPLPKPAPRTTWRGWLVPLAAAASVALVIGLALALTGGGRPHAGGPATGHRGPAGSTRLPLYFAQFAGTNPVGSTVVIRSVSTGNVLVAAPLPRQPGWSMEADAIAAAPDGRTFYVAYTATHADVAQTRIYRLDYRNIITPISDSAVLGTLTPIKGGVIPGSASVGLRGSMAVSPDGTKLALTVGTPGHDGPGPGSMDELAVVDLRSGIRTTWQGGLYRPGRATMIQDVSWRPDSRSVVFFALWCNPGVALGECAEAIVPVNARAEEIREIPLASGGGLLSRSAVLMNHESGVPVIAHATAAPEPGQLILVVLAGRTTTAGTWPDVTVERVDARTKAVLGTYYRLATATGSQPPRYVELGIDPSGRHLLLTLGHQGGYLTDWIFEGKLHPLPISQPYEAYPITAW